jgi:PAS domain S-box-containing protein
MVLPSLILRLEQLARPDAPPVPAATTSEPATAAAPVPTAPTPPPTPAPAPQAPEPVVAPAANAGRRPVSVTAPDRITTATPLSRWSAAVAAAHDACFVLDLNGLVISISVAAVSLLGCGDAAVIGRHIIEVINLIDLETGAPHPEYATRIPPLAVLNGPGLSRSLIRVRHDNGDVATLDTSSAPIHDVNGYLLGSVSFVTPIQSR